MQVQGRRRAGPRGATLARTYGEHDGAALLLCLLKNSGHVWSCSCFACSRTVCTHGEQRVQVRAAACAGWATASAGLRVRSIGEQRAQARAAAFCAGVGRRCIDESMLHKAGGQKGHNNLKYMYFRLTNLLKVSNIMCDKVPTFQMSS